MKERALDVFCMLLAGIGAGTAIYLVVAFRAGALIR